MICTFPILVSPILSPILCAAKLVPIGNTFVIIIIANKNVATILFFDFVIFLHTSLNLKINIKKKLALKGGNLLVSFHTYIF